MSRILIISAVFPPEPLVSAMLSRDIAGGLSKENSVIVLCPQPSRPEGFVFEHKTEETPYKVVRLDSFVAPASSIIGRLRESYSLGRHSVEYIRKNSKDIDCIYINSWPLASQYLIIKEARKAGIPSVLHIQDIYPESMLNKLPKIFRNTFFRLLLPLDNFILKNTTKNLGISENMITYLLKTRKVERSKFELVRNWQNDEKFLGFEFTRRSSPDFIFMYVGSISASAGVEQLIDSYHKANLKQSKLLIVGNGAEKKNCFEIAEKLKNPNIEFLEVSHEGVAEIQSKADVLLLPLRKGISRTATPSKLTAYLFSGKPVIACVETDSDVANILNEAACGFIVEPENIDAIAYSMEKVWGMEKIQLEEMGKSGKNYAIFNLSKKTNLNKVIGIIEDILLCK